jgi:DNA-binding GntR family transcriptional regulator
LVGLLTDAFRSEDCMNIRLHKNARTTPATRREIQQASGSDYELAERFGVTRQTIRK